MYHVHPLDPHRCFACIVAHKPAGKFEAEYDHLRGVADGREAKVDSRLSSIRCMYGLDGPHTICDRLTMLIGWRLFPSICLPWRNRRKNSSSDAQIIADFRYNYISGVQNAVSRKISASVSDVAIVCEQ